MKKGINIKISIFVLIILLSFFGYYFWPKGDANQEDNFFELKIVRNLEDWDERNVRERFDRAVANIEADPDKLDGWLALGSVKKHAGDFKGAEQAWIKAGVVRPFNSISFNNLASLYTDFFPDYELAEIAYQKAIENSQNEGMNPFLYQDYYNFALSKLKDVQKAEQILLQGIEDNPGSNLLYVAGNFYVKQGDNQKAIDLYKRYLESKPESEKVQKLLDDVLNQ